MTDRAFTGRFAIRPDRVPWLWGIALASAAAVTLAAEPVPEPPAAAQAAHQVAEPEGLRARLLRDEPSPVRSLDPAIFTELSPVTASEPALRLPEDQQDPQ